MTREEVVSVVNAIQRAWRTRDAVALASFHSEDSQVHSPIFGSIAGRPAIERTYHDLFVAFADWTLETEELVIDGSRVAQFFRVNATHTSEFFGIEATGRRFEIHGVLFLEFRDGLIVRERRLYDFVGMLLQLGVLKARPAKP
jgi:steroid delta-isomerase-like uncharacterized protein